MNAIAPLLKILCRDVRGGTTLEYGLLAGFIAVAATFALQGAGSLTRNHMEEVDNALSLERASQTAVVKSVTAENRLKP